MRADGPVRAGGVVVGIADSLLPFNEGIRNQTGDESGEIVERLANDPYLALEERRRAGRRWGKKSGQIQSVKATGLLQKLCTPDQVLVRRKPSFAVRIFISRAIARKKVVS